MNLIHNGNSYYLFNAHADVVNLTNSSGSVTKTYSYDAFGVEKNPSETDTNYFRYCGEYWDTETETYYLRARYYDPALGRLTQQDTHWNTANMIYGDNPQKINEREDRLGLKSYSFAPQISAVMQSGNLYVYCGNDPVNNTDPTGYVTKKGTPPPPSSGFVPKKGKNPEDCWNKEKGGWEDKNGNIWIPDNAGHGYNRKTGDNEHWDVQNKDGTGYVNVGKDGNKWGGKGKAPNLPNANKDTIKNVETTIIGTAIIAYGAWVLIKYTAATLLAPSTLGGSYAIASILP